jgi:hypothetical protein
LEFKQDSYFLDGDAVIGRKMNEKGGLYEKKEMERRGNFYYFGTLGSVVDKSMVQKDGQWKIRGLE